MRLFAFTFETLGRKRRDSFTWHCMGIFTSITSSNGSNSGESGSLVGVVDAEDAGDVTS